MDHRVVLVGVLRVTGGEVNDFYAYFIRYIVFLDDFFYKKPLDSTIPSLFGERKASSLVDWILKLSYFSSLCESRRPRSLKEDLVP